MLQVKILSKNARMPLKGSAHAAGFDLYSAQEGIVPARGKGLFSTDIAIALPEGVYGRIAPRSGLALNSHIDIGAGVVDRDYRGTIGVVIFNHSEEVFEVKKGDRIAQLILECCLYAEIAEVTCLSFTERGIAGFGSTGVRSDPRNSLPRLIAFCGKIGSGKSTAATHLVDEYGYAGLSFAKPLKAACRSLFGFTAPQVFGTQKEKETIDAFWGFSPRTALQQVGSALRNFNSELFVQTAERQIIENSDAMYVISDLRYQNEVDMIKRRGGIIISIQRDCAQQQTHESENQQLYGINQHIENNCSLADLKSALDTLLKATNNIK